MKIAKEPISLETPIGDEEDSQLGDFIEDDPKSKEKSDRNKILLDIMEQSINFYRLTLNSQQGVVAREYLDKRGLNSNTILKIVFLIGTRFYI